MKKDGEMWRTTTVIIIILIAVLLLFRQEIWKFVVLAILTLSSMWVEKDAEKIESQKYQSNFGQSPKNLGILTFIFWPIAFPGYLLFRYRVKKHSLPLKKQK